MQGRNQHTTGAGPGTKVTTHRKPHEANRKAPDGGKPHGDKHPGLQTAVEANDTPTLFHALPNGQFSPHGRGKVESDIREGTILNREGKFDR